VLSFASAIVEERNYHKPVAAIMEHELYRRRFVFSVAPSIAHVLATCLRPSSVFRSLS
jgi:hypothetical protein